MKIFVTDSTGVETEITDLYWFEEHGVHSFDQPGTYGERYSFRFVPVYFNLTVDDSLPVASCVASRIDFLTGYGPVFTVGE